MSTGTPGREQAVRFGASSSLVGVLTSAGASSAPASASANANAERPGILFLNSGILHRVGTCRLHVKLARALSAAGFASLRFDYSGIGDSEQRRDALPFEESAVIETREAMDYLARRAGVQSFVLIGLCSGADMAHETAVADERVRGLMLLDAWAWRTTRFYVHHYATRLFQGKVWKNAVRIRWQMLRGTYVDRFAPAPVANGVEYEAPTYLRVFPPRGRIASDLQRFVERGVQMYFLWTGGLEEYNHEGQYRATFPRVRFGTLLREEQLRASTHIVSGLEHQQVVVERVTTWLEEHFSGSALSAAAPESGSRQPLANTAPAPWPAQTHPAPREPQGSRGVA